MKKMYKSLISLCMAAIFTLTLLPATAVPAGAVWNGADADTAWYTADPSLDTFTIADAADLAGLAQLVNNGTTDFSGKTINLGADIALNDTTGWSQWDGDATGLNSWTPIGTSNEPFSGAFNGQDHTISGIYISSDNDYQGLFGYCYQASVSSLTVMQSYIKGGNYVGSIAGSTMNSTFSSCSNSGFVSGSLCVGGVVGLSGGTAGSCINSGSVTGGYGVGGIAGACGGTGDLTNCTNTGAIATAAALSPEMLGGIGGITGTTNADITGCTNSGTVTTSGERAGGVAGYAEGGTISGCHSTGVLTGGNDTGGVLGYGVDVAVGSCFSAGQVSAPGANNVGGIAGRLSVDEGTSGITQCYSTANISGMSYVGGIVGTLNSGCTVSACYSTGDVVCEVQGAGGIAGIMYGSTVSNCYTMGYVNGTNFVSGIVGYLSVGVSDIENCIALNPGITAGSGAEYVNRIVDGASACSNNYAWSGMPVILGSDLYSPVSNINGSDGESATREQLKSDTYWSTAGFTSANGWTYSAGSLPTLTNTGGAQISDLPLHIDPFPASAGTGTQADPYVISEAAQLAAVAEYVNSDTDNYASAYYELAANIDLSRIPCWEVIGIGLNAGIGFHPFTGSFDGCGYEIQNMTVSGLSDGGQGLFGYIGSGGIVKNVKLTNCSISCPTWLPYVGGVAGYVAEGAVIEGCSVSGNISGYDSVGGIAGAVFGTMRSCSTASSIMSVGDSDGSFGGIAGYVDSTGLVEKCTSSATVSGNGAGTSDFGGIAGYLSGTVQNCFATGNVSCAGYSGGIAGNVDGTIRNCFATGNSVSADSVAGNIAGYSDGSVTNCYYLDGAAPGSDEATAKTAAELAAAEMAWVLNTTNGTEANSGIWAQGATPVFADSTHKAVYKLTLDGSADPGAVYSAPDGSVTLPSDPTGTNGLCFLGWYEDAGYGTPYTAPATLTADDSIYGNFGTRILGLSDDAHTYNGAPVSYAGTLTDNASGIAGASPVTYTYYTDQSGTLTTAANGAAPDGAAPKNAGTYYAKAAAEANDVANEAESGYAAMAVSKADPVITVTTDHPSGQKYGQNVTVTVTVAPPSGSPTDGFPSAGEINIAAAGATLVTALDQSATPGVYTAVYTMPDTYSPGEQAVFTATMPSATANYNAYTATDKTASVALLDRYATVTQVTASDASITYGETVTVTAAVSADGAPALTGTVQFTLDGVNVGAADVSDNRATMTLDKTRLLYKANAYVVSAVFTPVGAGLGDYAGSSGTANITVAKKTLTIRPRNEAITAGAPLPALSLTYLGFVTGETEAVLTVTTPFAMEIQEADGSALTSSTTAGTYGIVITAGAATADNYTIITEDGTLTINSTGGNTGGGSSTPTYDAEVEGGGSLTVTVNTGTNNALVDAGALGGSVAGGGSETIVMPAVPGATSYTLGIPAESLSVPGGTGTLTFRTGTGSMTLPADMLAGIPGAEGKKAEITIAMGDKTGLSDDVKAAIGGRPLIELSLTLDGRQTDWSNPGAPVTVSIPYTPTAEELENPESIVVWYIDGSGNPVCIPNGRYDPLTGTVTFSTTHFSLFAAGYNNVRFGDVEAGVWYERAVSFIAARGITGGTGGGNFSPDALLTRGEFIVMLMRAYGIAPDSNPTGNFSDAGDAYYTGYLAAAKRLGIAGGVGDNMFAPGRQITRQELFTLLYNALKVVGKLPDGAPGSSHPALNDFTDAGSVADWAYDALALLVETGIVSGSGGTLNPTGTATRAEMARTLYNLLGKL